MMLRLPRTALHIVNRELRHVPLDAVVDIAAVLGLPPAEVQDTLTFYQFLSRSSLARMHGAKSHAPRHSAGSIVSSPSGVVP